MFMYADDTSVVVSEVNFCLFVLCVLINYENVFVASYSVFIFVHLILVKHCPKQEVVEFLYKIIILLFCF